MNRINILVPDLPESIIDATVINWHKKEGDKIKRDEILVEIETDKVILEVPAESSGILQSILIKEGSKVSSKQKLGQIQIIENNISLTKNQNKEKDIEEENLTPAMRRALKNDNNKYNIIKNEKIKEKNKNIDIIKNKSKTVFDKNEKKLNLKEKKEISKNNLNFKKIKNEQNRVPMTSIRKRIAERLLESKNKTAMLTTFNEVNLKNIISIRERYKEKFEKQHKVKLGFMSFFIKSVVEALKTFPEINAFIDGSDIIYHNYFDINIAISTPRGLVTPVLRNVDKLNIPEIEKKIKNLVIKGKENKLTISELTGGNFTITNGGIFGSLMSTPIINPPQTAILAMHAIKERPMVVQGEIKILPMMYLALSYDHCLIDGRESVGFLMKIKKIIESPIRLLLNI